MDGCGVRLYVVRVDRSIGRDADGERERERRTDGRMDGWLAMPGGVAGWLSIDQRIDAIRPNGRRERTESDGRGSYGRLLLQQYSLFVAYPDRLCGPPTFELVVYVLCLCICCACLCAVPVCMLRRVYAVRAHAHTDTETRARARAVSLSLSLARAHTRHKLGTKLVRCTTKTKTVVHRKRKLLTLTCIFASIAYRDARAVRAHYRILSKRTHSIVREHIL